MRHACDFGHLGLLDRFVTGAQKRPVPRHKVSEGERPHENGQEV